MSQDAIFWMLTAWPALFHAIEWIAYPLCNSNVCGSYLLLPF